MFGVVDPKLVPPPMLDGAPNAGCCEPPNLDVEPKAGVADGIEGFPNALG